MRLFVTGATGLVGSNVVNLAAEKYGAEVIATIHRTKPTKSLPCTLETVDITDKQAVSRSIKKHNPNVVIHTAAVVDAEFLEKNRTIGWKVFVEATEHIARVCQETKTKLIFISTDWIFDGLCPPFREDSVPSPINYYGILKVIGETTVRLICENYAIARVAAVYGINKAIPTPVPEKPYGFGSLVNYFVEKLRKGELVEEWTDYVNVKANPTFVPDIVESLMGIYKQDQRGIFHCCGPECISRVELARKVANVFDFDENLITTPHRTKEDLARWVGKGLRLPKESCVDTTTTEKRLQRINSGVEEGLYKFKKQMEKEDV